MSTMNKCLRNTCLVCEHQFHTDKQYKRVYIGKKSRIHSPRQLKRFSLIHDIAAVEFSKARGDGVRDVGQPREEDSVPLTHPLQ